MVPIPPDLSNGFDTTGWASPPPRSAPRDAKHMALTCPESPEGVEKSDLGEAELPLEDARVVRNEVGNYEFPPRYISLGPGALDWGGVLSNGSNTIQWLQYHAILSNGSNTPRSLQAESEDRVIADWWGARQAGRPPPPVVIGGESSVARCDPA